MTAWPAVTAAMPSTDGVTATGRHRATMTMSTIHIDAFGPAGVPAGRDDRVTAAPGPGALMTWHQPCRDAVAWAALVDILSRVGRWAAGFDIGDRCGRTAWRPRGGDSVERGHGPQVVASTSCGHAVRGRCALRSVGGGHGLCHDIGAYAAWTRRPKLPTFADDTRAIRWPRGRCSWRSRCRCRRSWSSADQSAKKAVADPFILPWGAACPVFRARVLRSLSCQWRQGRPVGRAL